MKLRLFQLLCFPSACEAYSSNIYIIATIELSNGHPTLGLYKCFLEFNLTSVNTAEY